MRIIRTFAFAAFAMSMSSPAFAECWKLKDGTVIETSSGSTAPVSGAKRTSCKNLTAQPTLPAPSANTSQAAAVVSGITTVKKGADSRECVEYARSKAPGLPSGLFTIGDKKAIKNASKAAAGYVAIIEVPSGGSAKYGHVAYVEAVTKDSITISETNFGGKHLQFRTAVGTSLADAEKQLRIVGYWAPN